MAIGDLFKPKHKHSKLEVRAAAVAAMGEDQVVLLAEVASADKSDELRKSAIAKINDPEVLATVADSQQDGVLREYATGLAVDMWVAEAIASEDLAVAKASFNRAAKLGGDKALAAIAGQARIAEVREQALARLDDDRGLAQVVRMAGRAEEWQDALRRILDPAVLRGIAVDEKRKEVAMAAVDAITDMAVLDEVATKAKIKAVRTRAKRSRAALEKKQTPESSVSNFDKRARAERNQLTREIETFAGGDEWIESRVTVDGFVEEWEELGDGDDEKLSARFHKALARYNKNFDIYGAVAATKAAAAAKAAAAKEKASVVEAAPVVEIKDAPAPADEAVESQAAAVPVEAPAPVNEQSEEAAASEADRRLENQDDLERLCETLEELLESQKLKGFDRVLKLADKARRKIGPLPPAGAESLRARYDESRQKAIIHLGDLREADEWKRWANIPKMEALVARAKALLEAEVHDKLGSALKTLQKEWRELGPAPRDRAEALWKIFKATCDEVYERVKLERERANSERKENLVKKQALCDRAEELSSSTDWEATSILFKEMQAEWGTIGPVPRRQSDALWKGFRSACDTFFEARAPHLEERFAEQDENLEAKQSLLGQLQGLAAVDATSPEEVEAQIEEVRRLQSEWRGIGRVARKDFEELNRAFSNACDEIYSRREIFKEAEKEAEAAMLADLEIKIEDCADAGWDMEGSEVAAKVIEVQTIYRGIESTVAGYEILGDKVSDLIRHQVEADPTAYTNTVLDPERSAAAREALVEKAQELAPEEVEDGEATPEDIANRLRDALADNAFGGVLSKTGGRATSEVIRELRAAWCEIGPVPGRRGLVLGEAFERACQRALAAE